jgi:YidC/Oxa1 family membrane protein insertase
MFDPLFDVVTAVLAWLYSLWPSYGMAIAFLTLTAMIAVTPLTLKTTRSMLQMQQHMPEVKKLQSQHKGDRQAMNEATMAYYKEHGLNPAGCLLPMLVQGPIFLVMYRVVHGLTRRTTETGTQIGFTSRRFADSASGGVAQYAETPISRGELPFDPDFLSRDSDFYARLSDNVEMVSWGVDLSRSASSAMAAGVVTALPYLLMMVIVLVTGLYQQRQIQGRQNVAAANPQQQMMMKLIPYILPVISYGIPAAVVIYFIVSNAVRIAQQAYITRSFYRGEDSLGAQVAKQRASAAADTEAAAGGGGGTRARSAQSVTEGKGAPTPRRDAKPPKAKAPVRKRAEAAGKSPPRRRPSPQARTTEQRGRTGKAPSRGRSGGRVTPPGSGPRRPSQNRSRSKRKRR